MKEKIERLAKEKFEYQMPELRIVPEKLEISTEAGRAYEGIIRVSNSAGRRMKGVICSDSLLLTLAKEQYIGEEIELPFVFHAEHAKAGERFEGRLALVTDAGEETLPYEVQVTYPALETTEGRIKDLYQFASLAKADWAQAEALFFGEDFAEAVFYRDKRFALLYRVLAATKRTGQAMEEFLIAAGKKTAVELRLERSEFSYEAGSYNFMDKLVLCKNSWGYVEGEILCDAGFVQLSRTSFTAGDFADGRLAVDFIVQAAECREGAREACIRVVTPKKELRAHITCVIPHKRADQWRERRSRKRALCELMRAHLAFYCAGENAKRYAEQARERLKLFCGPEGTLPEAKLYSVYLLQLSGRDAAARDALALLKEEELAGDARMLGALYCLNAAQKKDGLSAGEAADRVRELCRKHPEDAELFRYLLLLDEEYRDGAERFAAIREFTREYGYHALLLGEAVRILREDLSVLRELGGFELHVLKLALSCGCMDGELTRRAAYLAAREKAFSPLLYQVLEKCYKNRQDDELLEVICTLLIRSGRREARDYPWFARAVARQLKITQLEEYYMYCRTEKETEPIHPNVLLYFSYRCELGSRKKAMLYAELIRRRKENSGAYARCLPQMESFALEQLKKGAVNDALAVIYNELYRVKMPEDALAFLPQVAFAHKLTCPQGNFVQAAVFHPGQEKPVLTPIAQNETVIMLCTEDAESFLVDERGDFYPAANLKGVSGEAAGVTVKPMVFLEQHLWACFENGGSELSLLLHLHEGEVKYQKYGKRPEELSRRLAEHPEASEEKKDCCVRFLMEHYYENYESELFEYYLQRVKLEGLSKKERARIIQFFIMRGFDERAVQALKMFGMEDIEVKRLARLALRCLEAMEQPAADAFLLRLSYYIFECGRCDKELLSYLCRFYHGATEAMYAVWKTARSEELDTESLEESLLGQMLFAESCIGSAQSVFLSYYRCGTNRKLIRAFLNYYAYKFLLNDRVISQEIFELMEREASLEENEICTLALLKRYSQEEGLTGKQKNFLEYKLSGILRKGIVLPFFRQFGDITELAEEMYDKTFVEYHTDPSRRVVLHYRIGNDEPFSQTEMKNVCHGIFTAAFVLFHEEKMQYYITEEYDGQTLITESRTLEPADGTAHEGKSRYDALNLILAAHELRDEAAVMKLLENYIRTEYEAEHLFRMAGGASER